MRAPSHARRPRGFSLMETLVMLIISALAVTLMMQALASFNRSREHIVQLQGVRDNDSVALDWFGDSVRGLMSVAPLANRPGAVIDAAALARNNEGPGLHGDAHGFSAQTLSPLLGPAGTPVRVRWSIVPGAGGDARLEYTEPGHAAIDLPLRNAGTLRFTYLDQDGKAHENWPPQQGLQEPMPQTVELELGSGSDLRVVARSPMASGPMLLTPYAPPEDE